jgi:hypothetical protein
VSSEVLPLVALVVLPVLAVVCLGMLMRAYADEGGYHWALWAICFVVVCGIWVLLFRLTP